MVEIITKQLNSKTMKRFLEAVVEEAIDCTDWKESTSADNKSPLAREEFKKNQMEPTTSKKIKERCNRSLEIIRKHLGEYSHQGLCLKDLEKGMNAEAQKELTTTKKQQSRINAQVHKKGSESAASLAEQWNFSPETITTIYDIGIKLYKKGEIEEAICVFTYLSQINHFCHEVWVSLGLCHQKAHEWVRAIQAYTTANVLNPHDLMPYFYSIDCFVALHNHANAELALYLARYFMTEENQKRFAPLIDQYSQVIAHQQWNATSHTIQKRGQV